MGAGMAGMADILEEELEGAFEVKSKKSLHRYITLLTESLVQRNEFMVENGSIRSDIRVLIETMQQGFMRMDQRFQAVDKRFEAVDKRFEDLYQNMNARFEDVNRRFSMMFTFMTIGFTGLMLLMSLFKFIV